MWCRWATSWTGATTSWRFCRCSIACPSRRQRQVVRSKSCVATTKSWLHKDNFDTRQTGRTPSSDVGPGYAASCIGSRPLWPIASSATCGRGGWAAARMTTSAGDACPGCPVRPREFAQAACQVDCARADVGVDARSLVCALLSTTWLSGRWRRMAAAVFPKRFMPYTWRLALSSVGARAVFGAAARRTHRLLLICQPPTRGSSSWRHLVLARRPQKPQGPQRPSRARCQQA